MNELTKLFITFAIVLFLGLAILFPATSKGESVARGTGFFVNSDGYIVTNEHVIADAATVADGIAGKIKEVYVMIDGVRIPAIVVKEDPINDLALLRVLVKQPVTGLPLASVSPQPGEALCAVGHPLPESVNDGLAIECGMAQRADADHTQDISMDIAPGNSGSPVLNNIGEVIGVADAIKADTHTLYIGQSLAIDLRAIKGLLSDVKTVSTSLGGVFSRVRTPAQLFQDTKDSVVLIIVPQS